MVTIQKCTCLRGTKHYHQCETLFRGARNMNSITLNFSRLRKKFIATYHLYVQLNKNCTIAVNWQAIQCILHILIFLKRNRGNSYTMKKLHIQSRFKSHCTIIMLL